MNDIETELQPTRLLGESLKSPDNLSLRWLSWVHCSPVFSSLISLACRSAEEGRNDNKYPD